MDPITDYFISYDEDINVKQEKLSDPEVSLTSAFSLPSDSTSFYPSFINPTLRNMLENTDLTIKESFTIIDDIAPMKFRKPFKIIRPKREPSADSIEVKIEPEKKVITNSRREYRREVAKKKSLKKKEAKSFLSTYGTNLTPEGLSNLNIDEKTGKKLLQMIRNRISAQNSRDRRKAYLQSLEHAKDVLLKENENLGEEKNDLYQELKRLQEANMKLLKEREGLLKQGKKQGSVSPLSVGALQSCLTNLELPQDGEKCDPQLTKQGFKLGFQLALVISVMVMMRLNEQGLTRSDAFDEKEQAKLYMPVSENGDISFVKNEVSLNFLRKCSQSTTLSSQGSPLLLPNPLDNSFKTSYYNAGSDDEITTNAEHISSPCHEEQLKDFDLNGENLLMSLQSSMPRFKGSKSQENQTGGALYKNSFSKINWRMEGSQYL